MHVAYVLPRYGLEVLGGAEFAIRLIAERLVDAAGWDVSVLTTCALDARTWANHYPAGEVDIAGVRVVRVPTALERDPSFDEFSNSVLLYQDPPRHDQERWVDMQGPFAPDLLNEIVNTDADALIFKPYLYYPTIRGVPIARRPVLMHPAAHDEPALRLPMLRDVFNSCAGFVFNMHEERRVLESHYPETSAKPFLVSGFGIEPGEAGGWRMDEPYLLSVGRVDKAKGSLLLARWFAAYKERRPGPLKLVLLGQVAEPVDEHPDIVVAGMVDEPVKWAALSSALAVVQPSPYESLSLALLEAWAVRRPTMVNAACEATTRHVEQSGGGVAFTGYASFEVTLDRLVGDAGLREELGEAGYRYVDEFYRWPRIIERYVAFVERVTAAASTPTGSTGSKRRPGSRSR